jgi:hypothetical protein
MSLHGAGRKSAGAFSFQNVPPAGSISLSGRVIHDARSGYTPWRETGPSRSVALENDGNRIAIKNERQTMHLLLLSPVLASALYIGGGSVGLLLVIIVVVLLLR